MSLIRQQLVSVVLASTVGVAIVVGIAQAEDRGTASPVPQTDLPPELDALTTPATPRDDLPSGTTALLRRYRPTAQVAGARQATSRDGRTIFLVPDGDSVCMPVSYDTGESTLTCELTEQIAAGGNRPTLAGGFNGIVLSNIVPNGVTQVSVAFTHRGPLSTTVQNNVYSVEVDPQEGPVSVSYDTPAVKVDFPVGIPEEMVVPSK